MSGDDRFDALPSSIAGRPPKASSPGGNAADDAELESEHRFRERQRHRRKKAEEILRCLSGRDDVVDLWHLRELALSRGGLLSPTMRRRAWPKLVGVDEHILSTSSLTVPKLVSRSAFSPPPDAASTEASAEGQEEEEGILSGSTGGGGDSSAKTNIIEVSEKDLDIMKRDVGRSVWHVERHMKRLRRERDLERDDRRGRRLVQSRSPGRRGRSPVRVAFDAGIIDAGIIVSPPREELVPPSPQRGRGGVPFAVGGGPQSLTPEQKKKRIYSARREKEQELLLTIMASVLQSSPPDSKSGEAGSTSIKGMEGGVAQGGDDGRSGDDGRLHYYQGLHDIVALFLINLESPSLASLVLKRLAYTHLRDAMRCDFSTLHAALRLAFLPLLQGLDPEVHDYIVASEMDSSCVFALSWILSWFGHDILDVEVASRLVDFFLASHALMPIYLSVCVLAHPMNREKILDADCDFASLHMVLTRLPKDMMRLKLGDLSSDECDEDESAAQGTAELMELFEELIEMATSLMLTVPPTRLVRIAEKYQGGIMKPHLSMIPSIAMMKRPPQWAVAPSAPTDWGLMQQAKSLRDMSPRSRKAARERQRARAAGLTGRARASPISWWGEPSQASARYRTAAGASGLGDAYKRNLLRRRMIKAAVYVAISAAAIACAARIKAGGGTAFSERGLGFGFVSKQDGWKGLARKGARGSAYIANSVAQKGATGNKKYGIVTVKKIARDKNTDSGKGFSSVIRTYASDQGPGVTSERESVLTGRIQTNFRTAAGSKIETPPMRVNPTGGPVTVDVLQTLFNTESAAKAMEGDAAVADIFFNKAGEQQEQQCYRGYGRSCPPETVRPHISLHHTKTSIKTRWKKKAHHQAMLAHFLSELKRKIIAIYHRAGRFLQWKDNSHIMAEERNILRVFKIHRRFGHFVQILTRNTELESIEEKPQGSESDLGSKIGMGKTVSRIASLYRGEGSIVASETILHQPAHVEYDKTEEDGGAVPVQAKTIAGSRLFLKFRSLLEHYKADIAQQDVADLENMQGTVDYFGWGIGDGY